MRCLHESRARGTVKSALAAAGFFSIIGLLAACAGGSYGRLVGSTGIDQRMQRGPIGPDYRYYMTPSTAAPTAVIAIHKEYTLKTTAWTAIGTGSEQPKRWRVHVGAMKMAPKLLEIQGPNGEHIGLWYSVWTSSTVKLLDNNEVQVFPPNTQSRGGRPKIKIRSRQ
jgi:hypothetical protein